MTQWVKRFLDKQVKDPCGEPGAAETPALGEHRNRHMLGAHWPENLPRRVSSSLSERPIPKINKI